MDPNFYCNIKCALVGDVNVGKSSILSKVTKDTFPEEHIETIGVGFGTKFIEHRENSKLHNCKMKLWDISGKPRYQRVISGYLKDSVIVYFICAVNQQSSFDNLDFWLKEVQKNCEKNVIKVLILNKCDILGNFPREKTQEFVKKNNMIYFEISAKTGENINNIFHDALDLIDIQTLTNNQYTSYNNDPLVRGSRRLARDRERQMQMERERERHRKNRHCLLC